MEGKENPGSVRPFGFRAPRVSTNFTFSLVALAGGEQYDAVCTDISEDGLAAELLKPLAPQTQVNIRLLLPGATRPLQIEGAVEYSKDGRCGLTFIYTSVEQRQQIQKFVQSIS